MDRRQFLSVMAGGAGLLAASRAAGATSAAKPSAPRGTTLAGVRNEWALSHPLVKQKLRMMVMSDAHLTLDDARGEPWKEFSARMSTPYRTMKHWRNGRQLVSPAGFDEVLAKAVQAKVDFLALTGDIVSFPSEAGVDYVVGKLKASGLNWMYVSGNHDWHYEGQAGTLKEQRDIWTKKRLSPLYQGANPLFSMRQVKGVRMVFIDDSTWEILPEQLGFLRAQLASGDPVALFMHIPLHVKGYPLDRAPVGHPDWGWNADRNWQIERRLRWPKEGHTQTTYAFRDAVFAASNVVGVFTGHIHEPMCAVENGVPQLVTELTAAAGCLDVKFKSL